MFKKIPIISASALMPLEPLHNASKIIRHHREYQDGTGYPDALSKNDIPIGSQILTVVIDYYKLQEQKILKEKLSIPEAFIFLKNHIDTWHNKQIVEILKSLIDSHDLELITNC